MKTRFGYLDTMFLKAVIVLIGVCVVSFLLGEPHLEGRNATATPYEIYFHDPFLAYAYVASLSFFVALYHVFKMFGYAESNRLFSQDAIKTVRAIRVCALAMILFVIVGEVLFILPNAEPPGIVIGLFICLVSTVAVAATSVLEKVLARHVGV